MKKRKKIKLRKPCFTYKNGSDFLEKDHNNSSIKVIQLNLLLGLEEKFPSSFNLFYNKICKKSEFIKKELKEKKQLFLGFLKEYGDISITLEEWGSEIKMPPRKDGTELVAHIGTKSPMGVLTNFFDTLDSVLPELEYKLW